MPSIIDDPDFIPLTIEDLNTISQAEFDERVGHRLDAAPLYRALGKCVASGEFDDHFPDAERIRVVLDNLATHTPAALYTAFPPAEARRILAKLDFHFTPKHASWLNRVEIELSLLVKQGLNRRIADIAPLACQGAAWERTRNAQPATIRWMFDLSQARTKLSHLYPVLPS